jgi:eukaryotic-like serine/threonine-protein kinase
MDIDSLIAAGKYGDAAAEAQKQGDLLRAQKLYEKIWEFGKAAEIARERGDRPEALRLHLDARDFAAAATLGEALQHAAPPEQARAADVYERRRMWADAAALRERLGQLSDAHELYKKAQLPLEVARLDETLGRPRDAGIAYEKLLAEEPGSPDAARAHLSLGRILAGFGRHDEAARHLQKAIAIATMPRAASELDGPPPLDGERLARARRILVVELAALGYREAARLALETLRATDPRLPPLDAFLQKERMTPDEGARSPLLGGRYRVARLLGSGGMGRVYLARDELSGHDVAVKVVAPPVDERSAEGYRRFMREAKIVSSLQHPNIVSLVESHEDVGILALELMAGTLADRLSSPLEPSRVRAFALEILAGLQAAHAHGVIHRDLKPANIFFAASGEAKLGDFGVAHLSDLGATQTAGFIGTLAYMSPEQISGAPLTFAADVYALGVTLFQALTGRLPFAGPDFVGQHLGERAPAPSSLREKLDDGWDRIVARCLEKSPDARFASLDELRRALDAVSIEEPGAPPPKLPPNEAPATANTSAAGERYVVTSMLDGNLAAATDTRLGREVVIQDFATGSLDDAQLAWLRAIASHGGPRLQRVLRIEARGDGTTRVVYEALAGKTPRPPSLSGADAELLARALAPLHAAGVTHGSVASSLVLEDWGPALLTAGRRPSAALTIAAELAELTALVRQPS